jgi:DNA-binding MarR family transcriptional regulator
MTGPAILRNDDPSAANLPVRLRLQALNSAQFNVLTVLHRVAAPLAMRQLSTMMAVQPTNLSGIVRALRGRGFVKQVLNEADSRSLLVSITPEGEEFLADLLPTHWKRLEGVMASLSEDDRQTLVALLERLVHSIRVAERDKVERPVDPDHRAVPQAKVAAKATGEATRKPSAAAASLPNARKAPAKSANAKRGARKDA